MKGKNGLFLKTITLLLLLAVSGTCVLVRANWVGAMPLEIEISPQSVGANPPTITVLSPENGKTCGSNLTLHCSITLGNVTLRNESKRYIERLYYQEDWENSNTIISAVMALGRPVPQWNEETHTWETITVDVNSNLTEFSTELKAPTEGNHSITVWVVEGGSYQVDTGKKINGLEEVDIYYFHIASTKTVTFTVDNSPPEATTEVKYVSPISLVPITASVVSVGLVATGLLVYFKRKGKP
jgi:hypothetical protein